VGAQLSVRFPSLFRYEEVPESPLTAKPGLRLNARNIDYDGEVLAFDLLVSHRFPTEFVRAFHRLDHALACSLEDTSTPQAIAFRAIDPHKKYPASEGPNFRGYAPTPGTESGWMVGGHFVIPVELSVARSTEEPRLFASAFLHDHLSNRLVFDLRKKRVTSFIDGHPHTLALVGDREETESDDEVESEESVQRAAASVSGLVLSKSANAGEVQATLTVTPEELNDGGGPEGWLRSVFVGLYRDDTQAGRLVSWLGERLAMPDDFQKPKGGRKELRATLAVDVKRLFEGAPPGDYHLHVSARQFHARALAMKLP
jgi:hypothetical protein